MSEARLQRTREAYTQPNGLAKEVYELIQFYEAKSSRPNWDHFPYMNVPIELLHRIYEALKNE